MRVESVTRLCDKYLITTFGVGWNDLPDTVCVHDWVYEDTTIDEQLIKDICWEKLADDYPDRCELNKIIYGDECSCCLHEDD